MRHCAGAECNEEVIRDRCLNAAPSVSKLTIFNVIFLHGSGRTFVRAMAPHSPQDNDLSTRAHRSIMSWVYLRKHPCETNPATDPGLLVPWIAY
jgi:hypothetical protein